MDRKPTELDPVERAVLWVGTHELRSSPDVPYRVVINEAVGLAKRFGATDSHKFVNAVLDAASPRNCDVALETCSNGRMRSADSLVAV